VKSRWKKPPVEIDLNDHLVPVGRRSGCGCRCSPIAFAAIRRVRRSMSSLARRRRTAVLGSKRWWQGGCWATRSHQEAYLRKLYGRKNNQDARNSGSQNDEDVAARTVGIDAPWATPGVYDLPTITDSEHHYLDAFLRNREDGANDNNDDVDDVVAVVVGCPTLATSRASPTEKCVEFLKGAHHDDGTNFGRRAAVDAECGRVADCGSMHSNYDAAAGCSE